MFVSEGLAVNEKGHLTIGGMDAVTLSEEFGTPLYVMNGDLIKKHCRTYLDAMEAHYGGNGMVLYASKAFTCVAMLKLIAKEGMGLDVVSGGELYTAVKAGFPMEKVYFHGNNKTEDELRIALDFGVGCIVADNADELSALQEMAREMGKRAKVMFRIKPGIDAHTHDFIRTGQIDSKFGVALETGEAMEMMKKAAGLQNIEVVGVHCHIGSQIFDVEPFCEAARVMMHFMADVRDTLGLELKELNLGGGFGIRYVPEDKPVPYDQYMKAVSEAVKETAKEREMALPKILMEPGRSIAAPAGVTLYKVGNVKEIPGVRTYVSVDGGMTDNPRYILYQAQYDVLLANKANEEKVREVTVAGKCCESGDLIQEHVKIQEPKRGDILAVLATGAYNYSMSSNYNRIPRPAVVMIEDGKARVAIKRESYEDLVKNDSLE